MYRCDFCKVLQEANVPVKKVIVESRPKTYVNKYFINKEYLEKESHGWEIVREAKACPNCPTKPL